MTAPGHLASRPLAGGAVALSPSVLPFLPHPFPSFQIPVTQACLMEDIEQWLSTDVVSQGHPAQKERLRPTPHPPDGAPVPLMRKRLVVGQGDKLVVTRGALLWDTLVAGSVPSAGHPPRPGHFPLEKGLCTALHAAAGVLSSPSCQCEVPLGVRLSRALLHTTELPAPRAPRTKYLGTSRPRGCPLQATVKTMFLPMVP